MGNYPIVATVTGSGATLANYAATITNGTLTVGKASAIMVVAANANRFYGSANPELSGTISGILNNDDITAAYTCSADASSAVGAYPIVPIVSDPGHKLLNYDFSATNGTLTVKAVGLSATADDASRRYGVPNPVFTGTLSGLVNNDAITAEYSTTATLTSPPGMYTIRSNAGRSGE